MNPNSTPPEAHLLITSSCPYCDKQMSILGKFVKSGKISALKITNIEYHPEIAAKNNVRSVPWMRIGPFELSGAQTGAELEIWINRVHSGSGLSEYLLELLQNQQLKKAIQVATEHPKAPVALTQLLSGPDTPMGVRIGIAAMMEELADKDIMVRMIAPLGELSRSKEQHLRADTTYYLGLSKNERARPYLLDRLEDPSPEIREIATESLELLS